MPTHFDLQHPPTDPGQFRGRLLTLAAFMISGQFSLCLMGYLFIHSTPPAPMHAERSQNLLVTLGALAVLSVIASFLVVVVMERGKGVSSYSQLFQRLQTQFIVGMTLSEAATLFGLVLFFLEKNLAILIVLSALAIGGIMGHYWRITSQLDIFERRRR